MEVVKEPLVEQYHYRQEGAVKTLCKKMTGPNWQLASGIQERLCLGCRNEEKKSL